MTPSSPAVGTLKLDTLLDAEALALGANVTPADDAHLADADALTAAVEALLAVKPHLASRKPTGDIGQGATATADSFSLSGLLRSGA